MTRSETRRAGSGAEQLHDHLALREARDLLDTCPPVGEWLAASKPIKKSPPPKRGARLKYRNPLAEMEPGEAIECPGPNAGFTYEAAERRASGNIQYLRKARGWEFTTRREGGSLWVYRTA